MWEAANVIVRGADRLIVPPVVLRCGCLDVPLLKKTIFSET